MTTGERLVEISTLLTGTALEHFLNIQTGGGFITTAIDVILQAEPIVKVQPDEPIGIEIESPLNVIIDKIPNVEIEDDEIQV